MNALVWAAGNPYVVGDVVLGMLGEGQLLRVVATDQDPGPPRWKRRRHGGQRPRHAPASKIGKRHARAKAARKARKITRRAA